MTLPPEVLALLGPDATPEKAAERMNGDSEWSATVARARGRISRPPDGELEARDAYDAALAAAAIRECEAQRAYLSGERAAGKSHDTIWKELNSATKAYDALRNAGRTP